MASRPLAHVDTEAWEPFIIIDGKKYPTSGAIRPPRFSISANYSNNFNGTLTIQAPYKAPEGFAFHVYCLETSGFTQISTANYSRDAGTIDARVYQAGNSDTSRIGLIGWRLVSISTDPDRLNN
ncbi:hypothetical protein [Varibaculum cambriense]|uniref:hypothetical protein n=1 Tax=Varibaculum cambriense TaxID=184870 RepID=UPI0029077CB8|nr:hypothetical protein [Varibaculum cambriense]MDU5542812.1 hypothetical protein [Varibaculum cambriense]